MMFNSNTKFLVKRKLILKINIQISRCKIMNLILKVFTIFFSAEYCQIISERKYDSVLYLTNIVDEILVNVDKYLI